MPGWQGSVRFQRTGTHDNKELVGHPKQVLSLGVTRTKTKRPLKCGLVWYTDGKRERAGSFLTQGVEANGQLGEGDGLLPRKKDRPPGGAVPLAPNSGNIGSRKLEKTEKSVLLSKVFAARLLQGGRRGKSWRFKVT